MCFIKFQFEWWHAAILRLTVANADNRDLYVESLYTSYDSSTRRNTIEIVLLDNLRGAERRSRCLFNNLLVNAVGLTLSDFSCESRHHADDYRAGVLRL